MENGFFTLVGRFPLDIYCHVIANVMVLWEGHRIRVDSNLDSPVFLFRHSEGFFIQVACPMNGCQILVHENDIEFFDKKSHPIDLYDIEVQPCGSS